MAVILLSGQDLLDLPLQDPTAQAIGANLAIDLNLVDAAATGDAIRPQAPLDGLNFTIDLSGIDTANNAPAQTTADPLVAALAKNPALLNELELLIGLLDG